MFIQTKIDVSKKNLIHNYFEIKLSKQLLLNKEEWIMINIVIWYEKDCKYLMKIRNFLMLLRYDNKDFY